MMDVICQSAVASPLLQYKRDTVVNSAYDPAFTVKQIMKDLDIIAEFPGTAIVRCRWPRRSASSTKRRS